MKSILGALVFSFFAIWNMHMLNSDGQEIRVGVGPFSTYGECMSYAQSIGQIGKWTFEGCAQPGGN